MTLKPPAGTPLRPGAAERVEEPDSVLWERDAVGKRKMRLLIGHGNRKRLADWLGELSRTDTEIGHEKLCVNYARKFVVWCNGEAST